MLYCNTQTCHTRNLMVFDQHVTLLCQYSKTTALTGHDKLSPHGLDAITSDILIQDLAMARPFAQLAAEVCFGNDSTVRLYKNHLFVNFDKAFTTDDLSTVMKKYSLPRIQFGMSVNPWRHIQTAWKRKFKCAMEDLIEMDWEDDVEALQAGHTRATENCIYGLSTQSLAGAAEDVLPLYLQASTRWQQCCKVMPGGSGLPYRRARSDLAENTPRPMRDRSTDCAMDASMVDDIAARVVERLTPMLTELMQAITGSRSPPPTRKDKGKQREMDPWEDERPGLSETEEVLQEAEEAEFQAVILASIRNPRDNGSTGESSATGRRSAPSHACLDGH